MDNNLPLGRNPCFVRILFAINKEVPDEIIVKSRNPCFVRILFAILCSMRVAMPPVVCRNPCFVRILFAIPIFKVKLTNGDMSQSLFC
ncbi:MAG: hypothetical protein ACRCVG_08320 [Methanobacteriaceae archaeon]